MGKIDKIDKNYELMLQQMKNEEKEKFIIIQHVELMVKSEFTKMITPDEFEEIVNYINNNNKYRETTVKSVYGVKTGAKNWEDLTGYMLKFDDTLVSLIRRRKTVYKNGTSYTIQGPEEFVIGNNFDPLYTVKINRIPILKFDKENDIKSVDIGALILKPHGQTRIDEEDEILQTSMIIQELSDTVTSLLAKLQKTRAELAKAETEEKKGQASDVSVETKEQ